MKVQSLSSVRSLSEQVTILESVRDEIEAKVTQRRVALERSFPSGCLSESFRVSNSIKVFNREIYILGSKMGNLRITMNAMRTAIIQRKLVLDAFVRNPLPRRSHTVKACNKELNTMQTELTSVNSSLSLQRVQLLQEISSLYPIDYQGRFRTIRGLALPSLSALKRSDVRDEETISTALGCLLHRIDLASKVLDFPLVFNVAIGGSRSTIKDRTSLPPLEELPLFFKVWFNCFQTYICRELIRVVM